MKKLNKGDKMKKIIIFLLISISAFGFKGKQLRYPRVRNAYKVHEKSVESRLKGLNLDIKKLNIFIEAFKEEQIVNLYVKNKKDKKYKLYKIYKFTGFSGELGPKRMEGDLQIPEGVYHIDRFNPASNFYLSLGINYPNKSDRILSPAKRLGGDIFIHGSNVTIGCIPLGDHNIMELYLLAVDAKNAGQNKIPVIIYPFKMTKSDYTGFNRNLYKDLKKVYDYYLKNKFLPNININEKGRYKIAK